MRPLPVCSAVALMLCCGLAACGERAENKAATGERPAPEANAPQAAPGNSAGLPVGNETSPPAAVDGTGGRELAEGSANLDFIIVNRTGQTIAALAISPAGDESWTDNILAQRDVPPDERAAAFFTRDLEECHWDIRVTFEGGNRQSWPRINLCDTIRIELR